MYDRSCDGGLQQRERMCSRAAGSGDCAGDALQYQKCSIQPCSGDIYILLPFETSFISIDEKLPYYSMCKNV